MIANGFADIYGNYPLIGATSSQLALSLVDPAFTSSYIYTFTSEGKFTCGTLVTTMQKYRVVNTDNYGYRALAAMESPTPVFSDMGSAICDESGIAFIDIDPIYAETIENNCTYKVFYTQTSDKEIYYVGEKQNSYFIIHGDPGATLDWIIYAPQKDYSGDRLETINLTKT